MNILDVCVHKIGEYHVPKFNSAMLLKLNLIDDMNK